MAQNRRGKGNNNSDGNGNGKATGERLITGGMYISDTEPTEAARIAGLESGTYIPQQHPDQPRGRQLNYDPAKIARWKERDWDQFIGNPGVLQPDNIFKDSSPYLYIFDKACAPFMETVPENIKNMLQAFRREQDRVSEDATETSDSYAYSFDEISAIEEVNKQIVFAQNTPAASPQVLGWLADNLKRYPNAPRLYIQTIIAYRLLDQPKEERQLAKLAMEKFPTYLFSMIQYAQVLVSQELYDEMPSVFQHKYLLSTLYPGRELFHPSEYASFYLSWTQYFMNSNQVSIGWQVMAIIMENPHYNGYFLRNMRANLQPFLVECLMLAMPKLLMAKESPAMKARLYEYLLS